MAKRNYFLWGCLGCGGFLFLIFLIFASGIGFMVYQGLEYGEQIQVMYEELDAKYEQVDAQFPFTAPEDNLISEDRYQEFLQVRSNLGTFSEKYVQQFEDIGQKIGEQFESAGLWDKLAGISSIKDIIATGIKMPTEIGGEHVRLLQQIEMSNHEYVWICTTSLGALYQSSSNQYTEGIALWDQYRKQLGDIHVKMDEFQFDNNDVDVSMEKFLQKLREVKYEQSNAELVVKNSELLMASQPASMLDYFAVQINDIIEQHTQELQVETPLAQEE